MKSMRLLKFLQVYTDKLHPLSQSALRKIMGDELAAKVMGDKGTYARRLKEIADAYNLNDDGNVFPKEQWKIVYPGYLSKQKPMDEQKNIQKNGKVYYAHPVSYDEMDFLISSIRNSNNYTEEEKESLEQRLKESLCSVHYEYKGPAGSGNIWDWDNDQENDMDAGNHVASNISELRAYILDKAMIDIEVISDDESEEKAVAKYQVSPYRLVKYKYYYWLIANWHERPASTHPDGNKKYPWYSDDLTAYRIDLITRISRAHVPPVTNVKWTMNPVYMSTANYTRKNAESPRKARYAETITRRLGRFDAAKGELHFEHGQDIRLPSKNKSDR